MRRLLAPLVAVTVTAVVVSTLGAAPAPAEPAPAHAEPAPAPGIKQVHLRGYGGSASVALTPGGNATVTAGPLDPKMTKAEVIVADTSESGDSAFENLVFTLAPQTPGKRVLTCFYIAQFQQMRYDQDGTRSLSFDDEATTTALVAFVACLRIALVVAEVMAQHQPGRAALKPRCPTNPSSVPAVVSKTENGYAIAVDGDLGKAGKKAPLKVTCTRKAHKMVFSIRPKSKKKSLRSVVGKNLSLGIASPTEAEGDTTVKVTFRK